MSYPSEPYKRVRGQVSTKPSDLGGIAAYVALDGVDNVALDAFNESDMPGP